MTHFLLIYDLVDDYLERRGEFRDAHLAASWQADERGELLLGGALTDPADMAILIFQGDSPAPAEKFAVNDPYVKNGLVKSWRVRQWNTVVGDNATNPVHPAHATSVG